MPDEIALPPGSDIELKGGAEAAIESSDALDNLLKEAGGAEGDDTSNISEDEKAAIAAQKAEDDKARAEADAAEKAKTDAAAKAKADADAAAAGDDAAAKAKAEADAAAAAAKDEFDAIELPPHAKQKSVESFTKVKELARTKIKELSGTVEKLTLEVQKANEAVEIAKKGGGSPEDLKELEELRNFRRGIDVEYDPEFQKFDAQITSNEEAIYAKLTKAGFDAASIKRIKELGGPSQVDWGKLGDKVPADALRFLNVKLVENETLAENKTKAIDAAKKNSAEFLKNRQTESTKSEAQRKEIANKQFAELSAKALPWLKPEVIAKDAKPADKVRIEAHNKKVAEIQADVKDALNDHSPEMHAVLVTGYARMMKSESDLAEEKASRKAEVEALKKTIAEKEQFIASIQKSSTGRLAGGSSAPSGGNPKPASKDVDVNESSETALDRLRKEVEAKREAQE